MSQKTLPKTTIVDYTFLTPLKNQSYFYLEGQKAAREHVRIKFSQEDWKKTPRQLFEDFQSTYKDAPLFDRERLQALHTCLDMAVEEWTSFQQIFADIQKEYTLVITSLMNNLDELSFLKNKVQHLLCNRVSQGEFDVQRDTLFSLRLSLNSTMEINQVQIGRIDEQENDFVQNILSKLYDIEMSKLSKNVKGRRDLAMLGRWQFLKDWVGDRVEQNWVMKNLSAKIIEKKEKFRKMIPEEDELRIFDSDGAEVRKMKTHIDNLRKAVQSHKIELHSMEKKKGIIEEQISKMDGKILNISELLRITKGNNSFGMTRTSTTHGRLSVARSSLARNSLTSR